MSEVVPHPKPRWVQVNTAETGELIRASGKHGPICFQFGVVGVRFDPREHPWAEKLVARLRGETHEDGDGI